MKKSYKPVALIILDGLGIRERVHGNAVAQANTPNIDKWMENYERTVLDASEEAVGLPEGQMGNSEVGHLNLGTGRVVYQNVTKINKAITEGTLKDKPALRDLLSRLDKTQGKLHLLGLVSRGGVHSEENHLLALIKIADDLGFKCVIHAFTDGRDTDPHSGIGYVAEANDYLKEHDAGVIATVSGRYYAMDRDSRWQRTQKAYDAIVRRKGDKFTDPISAIKASYDKNITDEFIVPAVIETDKDVSVMPGDAMLFFDFRADRMRQIVSAIINDAPEMDLEILDDLDVVTMTQYDKDFPLAAIFPYEKIDMPLAEVISKAGKTQLHSAETEKYPHVTYFFNGGLEDPFENEDRILVHSPKVATYDLQPEMSAYEVLEKVSARIKETKPDFVLVNFANPDMVGHTGVLEAGIKAVEVTDECAGKLVDLIVSMGGIACVTADHGNCEIMIDEVLGDPHTAHTTQPVSFFVLGKDKYWLKPRGKLADVSPTILDLMQIAKPSEMTGKSLILDETAETRES